MKLLLALVLFLPIAAQGGQVVLQCQPPTQSTDGTPVKTPLTFKFMMGMTSGSYPNVSPPQPTCSYTWPSLSPNTYKFVAVTVDATGAQSLVSNEATKVVTNTPTTLGGPVVSLQTTKNSMVVPQIANVVAGKPCDPTQQFTFAGVTYLRTDTANVTPIGNVDLSQTAVWAQCQ